MDLDKLALAPWKAWMHGQEVVVTDPSTVCAVADGCDLNTAEFVALARNAFDVMMRRGWMPNLYSDGWWGVQDRDGLYPRGLLGCAQGVRSADPFTALVEADRWCTEHVGGQ